MIRRWRPRAGELPLVLPLPELIRIGERTVCLLHVPPGLSQVYHLKGQYWLRAGKENRVMTTAELRALLIARGEVDLEAGFFLVPDAVANDLDEAAVSRYLDKLSGVPVSLPGEVLHTRAASNRMRLGYWLPLMLDCCFLVVRLSVYCLQPRSLPCATRVTPWVMSLCARISAARWASKSAAPQDLGGQHAPGDAYPRFTL